MPLRWLFSTVGKLAMRPLALQNLQRHIVAQFQFQNLGQLRRHENAILRNTLLMPHHIDGLEERIPGPQPLHDDASRMVP